MVDLKTQYHQLQQDIDKAVLEALESCQFILGPNVTGLEKETAACLGSRYAVSCASGTDALHLAVLAAGIGAGDEVITTPLPLSPLPKRSAMPEQRLYLWISTP